MLTSPPRTVTPGQLTPTMGKTAALRIARSLQEVSTMKTLYLGNVPDDVIERLDRMATAVVPNWTISDPQPPSVSKPSCRHASYVAMPVAVARLSDRRPASMGMRTGSVTRGSANTSAGRPVGSAPNSSTSPVR